MFNSFQTWLQAVQVRRQNPKACTSELFILLHGMLFTTIQLDGFKHALAHFIEHLKIKGAEERVWIVITTINISTMLKYRQLGRILRKAAAIVHVIAKKAVAGVLGLMPVSVDENGDSIMKSLVLLSMYSESLNTDILSAFKLTLAVQCDYNRSGCGSRCK
ncbi:unnamed protein product [Cyclocybe aegerita]|uniref:Uncharacterized protein n=1 Tax=Cyclocybe aegerita TaxID=1973307 RepID=A0A8S0W0L7_CYCAE|nr:unnamed protein product [Cyclocybe aegerita]